MPTVEPPIANLTVFLKVFDVDDPFDQLNASMPNVSVIDGNASGPDDRGSEAVGLPWTGSAALDASGKARVTFTVSIQPGNNYRAGASLFSDAINQATQATADAINDKNPSAPGAWAGYSVPLTWSPMLTVWRKLHVEVDSMDKEPTTLEQRSPDWDRFDPIDLLGGKSTTVFDGIGLHENGPLAAGEVDHYEGGTLRFPAPAWDYPIRTNHSYFDSAWGGTLTEIRANAGTTEAEKANILSGPAGDVQDDDPVSGQLPLFYSVDGDPFITSAYAAAYIAVEQDDVMSPRPLVAFDLHLTDFELQTGREYDNAQDLFSETAYWASLVVFGYQPASDKDADPDPFTGVDNTGPPTNPNYDEGFEFGVTVEDSDNASVIYVEVHRDVQARTDNSLSHTIGHEIGHAAGPPSDADAEHNEGGLMSPGAPASQCCFSAQTLRRFREISKW